MTSTLDILIVYNYNKLILVVVKVLSPRKIISIIQIIILVSPIFSLLQGVCIKTIKNIWVVIESIPRILRWNIVETD